MKKHLVEQTFRDKETGQLILAGSFFSTEDDDRLDDLFKRGLLKSSEKSSTIKAETKTTAKKTTRKKSGD